MRGAELKVQGWHGGPPRSTGHKAAQAGWGFRGLPGCPGAEGGQGAWGPPASSPTERAGRVG